MIYKPLASADPMGVKELSFICKSGLFKYMEEMKEIWQNVICIISVASSRVFHLTSYNVLCLNCFLVLNHVLMIFFIPKSWAEVECQQSLWPSHSTLKDILHGMLEGTYQKSHTKNAQSVMTNSWPIHQWAERMSGLGCACVRDSHSAVRGIKTRG